MADDRRVWIRTNWGVGSLCVLAAMICFILDTFGVKIADHALLAPGLAFFALGHLI